MPTIQEVLNEMATKDYPSKVALQWDVVKGYVAAKNLKAGDTITIPNMLRDFHSVMSDNHIIPHSFQTYITVLARMGLLHRAVVRGGDHAAYKVTSEFLERSEPLTYKEIAAKRQEKEAKPTNNSAIFLEAAKGFVVKNNLKVGDRLTLNDIREDPEAAKTLKPLSLVQQRNSITYLTAKGYLKNIRKSFGQVPAIYAILPRLEQAAYGDLESPSDETETVAATPAPTSTPKTEPKPEPSPDPEPQLSGSLDATQIGMAIIEYINSIEAERNETKGVVSALQDTIKSLEDQVKDLTVALEEQKAANEAMKTQTRSVKTLDMSRILGTGLQSP